VTRTKKHKGYTNQWNYKENPTCNHCGVKLVKDREELSYNWKNSRVVRHEYACNSCVQEYNKKSNLKRKAKNIAEETKKKYNNEKRGYVYLIKNPAWSGWLKVGMAVDAEDRCNNYQTGSPYRDYELLFKKYFKNKNAAESKAHAIFERKSKKFNGEWFKINLTKAINIIEEI
tara:strand:- start:601 stop:1119 length:519 start_codon:yes stop_codon:yes gene_type:complete